MVSAAIIPQLSEDTPLLFTRGLTKRFVVDRSVMGRPTAWFTAVEDVTLELRQGETVGLVGESGSGKTTLARLILRLIRPSEGTVYYGDLDVTNASRKELIAFRQEAQIIFQDPIGSLDPEMRVEEIVAEGMPHLGMGREARRHRIRELLGLVELSSNILDRYPHEFSGGQRQRLSIARALAVNPKLLIADEPVSSMDVSVQGKILNLLRDLQEQLGLTYLLISHDLAIVRYMATRIVVMNRGRVVEMSESEDFFQGPKEEYSRSLLAAVPSLVRSRITRPLVERAKPDDGKGEAGERWFPGPAEDGAEEDA